MDVGQEINVGPGKFGKNLRSFKSEMPLTINVNYKNLDQQK